MHDNLVSALTDAKRRGIVERWTRHENRGATLGWTVKFHGRTARLYTTADLSAAFRSIDRIAFANRPA